MNTFKTLLSATLLFSVAAAAQADNSLSSLIYEESSNIYSEVNYKESTAGGIRSYGDDHNQNSVWSSEYEQYVNPADFKQADIASAGDVNKYMSNNPTAAETMKGRETFIYNKTAGEYHLQ